MLEIWPSLLPNAQGIASSSEGVLSNEALYSVIPVTVHFFFWQSTRGCKLGNSRAWAHSSLVGSPDKWFIYTRVQKRVEGSGWLALRRKMAHYHQRGFLDRAEAVAYTRQFT